ncbi:MAG: 4-(cytidine 5'-diphospho)-2-C-methyl-D-erythritol kinase [Pyrinomonadaceae bacterium]
MTAAEIVLPSFAKINLSLRVVGKRPDGYHELCTTFQSVSLADRMTFTPADRLSLECTDPGLPIEGNLVLRAAEALRSRYGVTAGAAIRLEKRIPFPGGLGGGSSNAAVTLLALNRLWSIGADVSALAAIGGTLGADVPYFFYGGRALGTGRGDAIDELEDLQLGPLLIVVPDVDVPTADAFRGLNFNGLTSENPERILQICREEADPSVFAPGAAVNDLEPSVFENFPEVARVKRSLIDLGATHAAMSGSGASVFAVFDKEETRHTAIKALDNEVNWRKFAVAAISRSEYREALRSVF